VLNSQRGGIGTFGDVDEDFIPTADGRLDAVKVARYRQRGYNGVSCGIHRQVGLDSKFVLVFSARSKCRSPHHPKACCKGTMPSHS
jgi:hypothetical protein